MRRLLVRLLLLFFLVSPGALLADLVVVVNTRSGVAAMTRNDVINLFFGRNRQFFNGLEAMPVDLHDSHPARAEFYRSLVGKDLAEINAYWSRQIFTGGAQALPRVDSTEEVIRWVASRPGGVGFVELSRADARVRVVFELKAR